MKNILEELDKDIVALRKKVHALRNEATTANFRLQAAVADLESTIRYRRFKAGGETRSEIVPTSSIASRPSPVTDLIYNLMLEAKGPIESHKLLEKIRSVNKNFRENNFWMALSRMQKKSLIIKVSAGIYDLKTRSK